MAYPGGIGNNPNTHIKAVRDTRYDQFHQQKLLRPERNLETTVWLGGRPQIKMSFSTESAMSRRWADFPIPVIQIHSARNQGGGQGSAPHVENWSADWDILLNYLP
jgi:hypothetical protein